MADRYALKVVTPPAAEPVTKELFKLYAHVDSDAEDALIEQVFIPSARVRCEGYSNRSYIHKTYRLTINSFKDPWDKSVIAIQLPRPPLVSVEKVEYVDRDGVTRTVDPGLYTVDTDSEPGRLMLKYDQNWPTPAPVENAVSITYVAGYGAQASSVPAHVVDAILLAAATRSEHREEVVIGTIVSGLPETAKSLLGHDRVWPI